MAATQSALRSVNCTQCGAPLELHGGHRVQALACSYCGAVLDSKDEYKVVQQFVKRDRPPTPFELGMKGVIHGVEFTIIGMVQWRTMDGYAWLEFQIFSPTHGYAWLEIFRGHYIFSRRVRDLPTERVSPITRSQFRLRDGTFSVFESYSATILYVEGELTFIAEAGDNVRVIDAIDPPRMVSVEYRDDQEEEYSWGEYLQPEDVHAAFGLTDVKTKPIDIHPAQPFIASPLASALSRFAKYFAIGAGCIVIAIFLMGRGSEVLNTQFTPDMFDDTSPSASFTLAGAGKLLKLELFSPITNNWANYDVIITRDNQPVFSLAKQLSYYNGVEGGESWSEGSQSADAYFKLPDAGRYELVVQAESAGRGKQASRPPQSLRVTIKEGIIVSRYFIALMILMVLAAAWLPLSRLRFESKRWEDGDDDDD
ncbi:MAG: DUF4178 domain-containing protein [Gammaproteobacteria bacterium]|nr:DUF4178 domain-containing protein [Gammaproteobacteria bacterium]